MCLHMPLTALKYKLNYTKKDLIRLCPGSGSGSSAQKVPDPTGYGSGHEIQRESPAITKFDQI